ncbi:hypothetical protein M413DRAFT_73003 [Hebeloma cylindrosporum]|uniref:Uncharacterized protein n=1 Tax=Hebeloma cylindrosporum TaxID=76867 RepID=A0A0C3BVM1_HEBCY|nr:hypothetical protein M413DRAFT_73003 [Hebeloma cylindrosporum h7]
MNKQLTSLTQWSQEHIRAVFESVSDEDSAKAVEHTFSKSINASLNGRQLDYAAIKHLVFSMRKEAPNGLKVKWQQTVDVPCDSTNRDGSFGGVYIIEGIRRVLPDHTTSTEFSRCKAVTVRIESESKNLDVDSRRIVTLVFVARDIPTSKRAFL